MKFLADTWVIWLIIAGLIPLTIAGAFVNVWIWSKIIPHPMFTTTMKDVSRVAFWIMIGIMGISFCLSMVGLGAASTIK